MSGHDRSRRGERLARWVLGVGLLSVGALLWAAFAAVAEPGVAGRAALARLAGEIADELREEWDRLLLSSAQPAQEAGEIFSWSADQAGDVSPVSALVPGPIPGEEAPAPVELFDVDRGRVTAFDALMSEAQRLELSRGNPAGGLELVLEALEKPTDAGRQAEGRLRALQLAVLADDGAVLQAQWALLVEELDGHELRRGTPYLLLAGLVTAEGLPPGNRDDVLGPVVDAWAQGRLRMPGEDTRVELRGARAEIWTSPVRAALIERLASLSETLAPRVRESVLRERRAAVASVLGGVPRGALGRWTLRPLGEVVFLARTERTDGVERTQGFFTTRASVEGAFTEHVRGNGVLPQGFAMDFAGDDTRLGVDVRGLETLEDGVLSYVLRTPDPDAIAEAEGSRVVWVRRSLLLAAAFSAAAALAIWRALRRQARLAALKSRFVASVSHELRTPVASILLLAENLESGAVTEEASRKRYHGLIRREALRLRRLVNDVLDFSRLERGEPTRLRKELVAPGDFAHELADELASHAAQSGASCESEIAALPDAAELDTEAVRRALLNLVDNAIRHGGGGALLFRASCADDRLELAIGDRGPGIPDGRRELVFEPFRQETGSEGTGLGLSIVRAIAEGHGGIARVTGRDDGPGALFELVLPLHSPNGARP